MDDTTYLPTFAALLPRVADFARDDLTTSADRELFDKMITGLVESVMSGFQAYSTEFGAAFEAGRTQLTVSYDDNDGLLDAAGGTGKYSTRYVKP